MTVRVTAWLLAAALGALGCRKPAEAPRAEEARPAACRPEMEPPPPSGEGMWPWSGLGRMDERELAARGLHLRLGEIWTEGKGGIAQAAVGLEGCSASFVSADGLLVTNHHCAHGALQRNSTPGRNLLEEGFLAGSRGEELEGHGLKVLVFQAHRDVTRDILDGMGSGITDLERMKRIERREKEIVAECERKPDTRCEVARENDGLGFVLLEKLEIRDVRVVAAPPESVGSFGGEVDNWRWPRHSLDFALLRAYVSGEGKPAAFGPDNVPYRPPFHFEVSTEGVSPGDLVMVIGTPYSTSRYLTSLDVRDLGDWYYPAKIDLFTGWIGVLEETCRQVPASCIPTASRLRGLENGLTNARGMIEGIDRGGLVERKDRLHREWAEWVEADPERAAKWGSSHDALVAHLEKMRPGRDRDFLLGYLLRGSQMLGFARTITKWAAERAKPDADREPGYQDRDREDLLTDLEKAQLSLDLEADGAVLALFLGRIGRLPAGERVAAFDAILGPGYEPAAVEKYVASLYAASRLGEWAERKRLFDSSVEDLGASGDALIALALALAPELDAWLERKKERGGALSRLRPPYVESLVAMRGTAFYPDANASPRVSFAAVAGYSPRDGVWHTPVTTLGGLLAKVTGSDPFDPPAGFVEAIRSGDRGRWVDPALGDVPACFLSNADTTGGNSGSPVLDGSGRLVGLNFDRVYENIAGDLGYNPALSRNIMVDIRAVLWYLDKVAAAEGLLEEMGVR